MEAGQLIVGMDDYVARWVAEKLPHAPDFGECTTMAAVSGNRILAGFVYTDYMKKYDTIQLSLAAASPRWAKRETMRGVLAYAFEQLGCFKVWLAIAIENDMMRRTTAHIGFTQEAILAHQFGENNHAVVERMLRPDFHRIFGEEKDNGQVQQRLSITAAAGSR